MLHRLLPLAALLCAPAFATEKPKIPSPPPFEQHQAQDQAQHQEQAQSQVTNQTVNASGGSGGHASNAFTDDSTTLAFGTTSPIPAQLSGCWVPAKGFKRGHTILWGLWQASAILELNPECVAAVESQRQHERDMAELNLATIKAQTERDNAVTARIEAAEKACSEIVSRGVEACNLK